MKANHVLTTPLAERLYLEVAEPLPLIDYHNHLSVSEIASGRRPADLTGLWLRSDPYKHRAMRIFGIDEALITGDADPFDMFKAWCQVLPQLIGNPLYDWSALELARVFQIDWPLNPETAEKTWQAAGEQLADPSFTAQNLLRRFHVRYTAPCAALNDDLGPFAGLHGVAPSFRGDDLSGLTPQTIRLLEGQTGMAVDSLTSLAASLEKRLGSFHDLGCRFADHALDNGFCYHGDDGRNDERLRRLLAEGRLEPADAACLDSAVLRLAGSVYARFGWTMQLHLGALRQTSSRLRRIAGPAGGYAGIGRVATSELVALLDGIEQGEAGLPRTVLFCSHPEDSAALAVLGGSFSQDGVRGKVQLGPPWWWCDHLAGMRSYFETISAYGVLSVSIGMTTDSRSFLSLVRHEYFRRTLCGWLGEKAADGIFPDDFSVLAPLVKAVCFGNVETILAKSGLTELES
ncbi:MAG: glucuronate isomerase [Clostridiales bacterium]|nr:glucuronate isomerase [Clostridiales bacterium]